MISAVVLATACLLGSAPDVPATPSGPQVRLNASTLQPYVGQEIELFLEVDIPEAMAQGSEPLHLDIPWLRAEFGFTWSLPPEQWLRRHAQPAAGTRLLINAQPPPVWVQPLTGTTDKLPPGVRRYRLTWKLIPEESQEKIRFEPVQLQGKSVPMVMSNPLELSVQELPVPVGDLLAVSLGVGRYRLEAVNVDPSELVLGQRTVLTLKLSGTGALARVPRPALADLPEFRRDFLIEDGGETLAAEGMARSFRYYLQPRHAGIRAVPPIVYTYFDPTLHHYQTQATASLPLTVQPAKQSTAPVPLPYPPGMVPERLQLLPPDSALLRQENIWPNHILLGLILVVPPILWGSLWLLRFRIGLIAWRWKSRRWSLAAREAWALVRAAARGADGELAAGVTQALAVYLHRRFRLDLAEPTPLEVEPPLQQATVPPATIASLCELLNTCAAVRFAPLDGTPKAKLLQMAEEVITQLEEVKDSRQVKAKSTTAKNAMQKQGVYS